MKKQLSISTFIVLLIIVYCNPATAQQNSTLDRYWFQGGFGGSNEGISLTIGTGLQSGKFVGSAKIESSSQLLFSESWALVTGVLGGISFQNPSFDSKRSLSLNLQAGVGTFTLGKCVENCGILSSEEPKNKRETSITFPINAQMLSALSKNVGFGFEAGINFNSIKTYPSVHFTLVVGKLL